MATTAAGSHSASEQLTCIIYVGYRHFYVGLSEVLQVYTISGSAVRISANDFSHAIKVSVTLKTIYQYQQL